MTFDGRFFMGLALGALAFLSFLIWVLVEVRNRNTDPTVKEYIDQVLYYIDEQCDDLETPAKRLQAIIALQSLLGWKRFFLPSVLIGWSLDLLVKLCRKIGVPDLHKPDVIVVPDLPAGDDRK